MQKRDIRAQQSFHILSSSIFHVDSAPLGDLREHFAYVPDLSAPSASSLCPPTMNCASFWQAKYCRRHRSPQPASRVRQLLLLAPILVWDSRLRSNSMSIIGIHDAKRTVPLTRITTVLASVYPISFSAVARSLGGRLLSRLY